MFKLAVIGTVAALATAKVSHPINNDIVSEIKQKATTWTPMEVQENPLAQRTIDEINGLFGAHDTEGMNLDFPAPEIVSAPKSFDWRNEKPNCVHAIRDQQHCGSCWAFGASEALSDRFCVASKGKIDVVLSPQDLVSCDRSNYGCNGGYIPYAWTYMEKEGIVEDSCEPYESGNGRDGGCKSSCVNGAPFKKYKCKAGTVVKASTPEEIESYLFKTGPLETRFDVYSDFMSYKSGVYQHTTGYRQGGHAIKLVGYGEENGVKYWICANSWGTGWGENGFFRIAYGECGIDSTVMGCEPDLNSVETF